MTNLLQRISALVDQALGVDLCVPNDTGQLDLDSEIADTITSQLDAGIELLSSIGQTFEPAGDDDADLAEDGSSEVSVLRAIGAEISSSLARQEIADLAFLGRNQLIEARRQIEPPGDRRAIWARLAHCETGLRRLRKALVAVESALREYEGLEAIPRCWESVDDALEIRRVYSQFRRAVRRGGQPRRSALRGELKRIAHHIVILRDRSIYPYLRIEDRRAIRTLQKRIDAWLEADDGSDAETTAGQRLWNDLATFADLIAQVNQRQTLHEHDRSVVASALHTVGRRVTPERPVPGAVLETLHTLLGRDEELDELLLDHRARLSTAPWRQPLRRVLRELQQPYRG